MHTHSQLNMNMSVFSISFRGILTQSDTTQQRMKIDVGGIKKTIFPMLISYYCIIKGSQYHLIIMSKH